MLERVFNIAPGVVGGFVAPACGEGDAAERYGIVCPCQTHTANVGILSHPGESFPETDAVVTHLKGVRIGVRTADCVPVVLYAPGAEVIAAVHAGWKGTLAGIVRETLGVMSRLGADMEDVLAFFRAFHMLRLFRGRARACHTVRLAWFRSVRGHCRFRRSPHG